MAGENRGKAVEVVVHLAIEGLVGTAIPKNAEIVWDESAPPLSWKPDIFIPSKGRFPGLLVLVTFSGSETDSRQKFWRNLAEYFDAKEKLPGICAMSVLAGARVRNKLLETQGHVFNGVFQFEDHANPRTVAKWLTSLTTKKTSPASLLANAQSLSKNDPSFRSLVLTLRKAVANALATKPALSPTFWKIGSTTRGRVPSTASDTSYRRGVAKALLFDNAELSLLKANRALPSMPHHVALLRENMLCRSISGTVLADPEIRFALGNVPDIGKLIESNITDVGASARERIWNLGVLEKALKWCRDNWVICTNNSRLTLGLQMQKKGWPSPAVLYRALKTTLAMRLGRQGQAWLEDVADQSGEMRSILVGLILPKFERGAHKLPAHVAQAVASALCSRTHNLSPLNDKEVTEALDAYVSGEIEARLVCHGIDAVKALLVRALDASGVAWKMGRLPSGLAECLGYPERDLGTSGIVAGKATFIHWKTVTNQGRDHKVKELYARGFQGGREWIDTRYRRRALRCLLVVDGTWGAADFTRLASGVWDGIYYPHELDELIKTIV